MPIDPRLLSLKQAQLKHLSFLSGCISSSGTKSTLQESLSRHLARPLIDSQHGRVLSIDMGIRNLAYCVIESKKSSGGPDYGNNLLNLRVRAWKKIDLLDQIKAAVRRGPAAESDEVVPLTKDEKTTDLFSPSTVSKIAYHVTTELLSHEPSTILIERQRFRSAGGSAIQEWTIRVNMLESMLWSCLTTMQHLKVKGIQPSLAVHGVNPARVAKFWVGSQAGAIKPTREMLESKADVPEVAVAKTTKQDRVKVLQTWLRPGAQSTVHLDFANEAADVAATFQRKKKTRGEAQKQKLDDLTDCLLQGAAWFQWEANRHAIKEFLMGSKP